MFWPFVLKRIYIFDYSLSVLCGNCQLKKSCIVVTVSHLNN